MLLRTPTIAAATRSALSCWLRMSSVPFHDFVRQRADFAIREGDPGNHLVLVACEVTPRFGESVDLSFLRVVPHDSANFVLRLPLVDL